MGLHPTTTAGYPKLDTAQGKEAAEVHSLTWCLRRDGILACVTLEDDGNTVRVVVRQCTDAMCTNVHETVMQVMRRADPARVAAGRVTIVVGDDEESSGEVVQ